MRCRTSVRPVPWGTTSCDAKAVEPMDRWRQVHERPGSTSVTSHTTFGRRGCSIAKRWPTSMAGPSSGTTRSTDAVHSGQRSTSANTSQTIGAGAPISTLLSVIMYQMVQQSGPADKVRSGHRADGRLDQVGDLLRVGDHGHGARVRLDDVAPMRPANSRSASGGSSGPPEDLAA